LRYVGHTVLHHLIGVCSQWSICRPPLQATCKQALTRYSMPDGLHPRAIQRPTNLLESGWLAVLCASSRSFDVW